jgi:hypothetical protein
VTNLLRILKPGGRFLLQTAYADNPAVKNALLNDYLKFYKGELEGRLESGYPPYSEIAKLTYAKKVPESPEPKIQGDIEVFGPFRGDKYHYFILRGKRLSGLGPLERPWKLDIDPSNL